MMRIPLVAIAAALIATAAQAQSCDTLGGGVNCNVGRGGGSSPLYERKPAPDAPKRTIGQDPDSYKIIENDTSRDPAGRPKATFGGTTFYSDGRQCTRIGVELICK